MSHSIMPELDLSGDGGTVGFRQEVCIQLARKMSDHLRIFGLVNDDTGQDVFNCLADHLLKTPDNLLMEYLGIAKPINRGEDK